MNALRLLPIAIAALLAVAGTGQAEGQVAAGMLDYSDQATFHGGLAMLLVADARPLTEDAGSPQPWLQFTAASVTGTSFSETHGRIDPQVAPVQLDASTPADPQNSQDIDLAAVRGYLESFQAGFELHIYTLDGTLPMQVEADGGKVQVEDRARMGLARWGETADGNAPSGNPDDFALVDRPGPWLVHDEPSPRMVLAVEGDFVVEMVGLTLAVEDAAGASSIESGVWHESMDPNAPPSEVAYNERRVFVRLHLEDALLEFATDGGDPVIFWAAAALDGMFSGPATLLNVNGEIDPSGPEPRVLMRNGRYVVPANSLLNLGPSPDQQMTVAIEDAPVGPRGTFAEVPAPASAALIGTGAVLALGIAVGIGVVRRLLRLPALADVEAAIEEGEYRKAARLAGRILARLPGSEEALLGRAIALSKQGQHSAVVAEITQHLARRPASDGTLHYVLGLAQLDAGRQAEAQVSLREAVRLTPALQAEVAPRLGKAFSVAPTTTKETHGYA